MELMDIHTTIYIYIVYIYMNGTNGHSYNNIYCIYLYI